MIFEVPNTALVIVNVTTSPSESLKTVDGVVYEVVGLDVDIV